MARSRPLHLGARTLLLTTLLVLSAACASAGAAQPAGSPQGAGSGSAPGSAGSGGSAAAGTTGTVPPATGSSSAPAPSPGGSDCAAPASITIVVGHEPAPVCMRVGDTVTITAPESPRQPWQPLTSSNAAVLACTSHQEVQGALTAVCHALKPGAVIASTVTAPFPGDPHGPPQFRWALTIHVLPYV